MWWQTRNAHLNLNNTESPSTLLSKFMPVLIWAPRYSSEKLVADLMAALVVAIMLIPQAMAYALLAGMPVETGLYASLLGLVIYCLFGSSNTLSVAPVAVVSLMTAAALSQLPLSATADYVIAAFTLTVLCGVILLVLGILRLGFLANFISQPVVSAFITASAFIIGLTQVRHVLGVEVSGQTALELLPALLRALPDTSGLTVALGLASIAGIVWCRTGLRTLLRERGISHSFANALSRSGPILVTVLASLLAFFVGIESYGVDLLGLVPAGLPILIVPGFSMEQVQSLLGSALLIAIIGFVESVSVAQVMAMKRGERIDLNQELVGLGAANIGSAMGGGFPVSGGFSRSVVNYDAGAATPAAGLFAAMLIALVVLLLTPILYWIPRVCLAAIILVAVYSLVDFSMLVKSWHYSKADFTAVALTLLLTLSVGVEAGIATGVLVSIVIHLYKESNPHVAVVGRVTGTEHFRNVERHQVETFCNQLSLRIDESLYFANVRYLEELIHDLTVDKPELEHVILMCTAVNRIDLSALETLERINQNLQALGISLHLSEVKGPIMDSLATTGFLNSLTGNNYLSHNQAVDDLQ